MPVMRTDKESGAVSDFGSASDSHPILKPGRSVGRYVIQGRSNPSRGDQHTQPIPIILTWRPNDRGYVEGRVKSSRSEFLALR